MSLATLEREFAPKAPGPTCSKDVYNVTLSSGWVTIQSVKYTLRQMLSKVYMYICMYTPSLLVDVPRVEWAYSWLRDELHCTDRNH